MTRSIRSLIVIVAVGAMVLLLSACGNTTSNTSSEANESNETTEVSETSDITTEMPVAEATTDATSEDSVDNGADEASEISVAEATSEATEITDTSASSETVASTVTCTLFNLNTVTGDELLNTLPNFSDRMVREFGEYQPYVSIQQFRLEIGKYVGDAQVSTWEAYVYVPVDPNNSDSATLQQLPGVDESIASTLIDARPYADQQAFLDKLGSLVSAEQLAQANCYLGA